MASGAAIDHRIEASLDVQSQMGPDLTDAQLKHKIHTAISIVGSKDCLLCTLKGSGDISTPAARYAMPLV